MTDRYGVMGYPVSHSKSPRIHSLFASQTGESLTYEALLVQPGEFPAALARFKAHGGRGLNITLPFKQEAFDIAAVCSPRAQTARAANTLWFDEQQGICADNTDGVGLIRDLSNSCSLTVSSLSVLLIGAGGAARGAACALLEETPKYLVVANRTHEKAENLVRDIANERYVRAKRFDQLSGDTFDLVINATAASLKGETPPISPAVITSKSVCYDMMYGSSETAFVAWGREHGACCSTDGLGMLVEQAAESFYIWRGVRPDSGSVLSHLREEMRLKTSAATGR